MRSLALSGGNLKKDFWHILEINCCYLMATSRWESGLRKTGTVTQESEKEKEKKNYLRMLKKGYKREMLKLHGLPQVLAFNE